MARCAFCAVLALGNLFGFATAASLSDAQKTAILDLHNKLRGQKHANQPCGAADMQKLTWDATLAAESQAYADKCIGDHDLPGAGTKFGENLWMNINVDTFTTADLTKGTQAWYDEVVDTVWRWGAKSVVSKPLGQCTDISDGTCNIGHYFQVIWAKAAKLGCGVSTCSKMTASGQDWGKAVLLVCRYDVPASHAGGKSNGLPYEVGKACAACPNACTGGLCTATPSSCVDRSSSCADIVGGNNTVTGKPRTLESACTGVTVDYCQKTCKKCSVAAGVGYDQCPGYSADLIKPVVPGVAPCKLPAGPLNSEWECTTADTCRKLTPSDAGFFMYDIAPDADIQCKVKCKYYTRGALGTGAAIRYQQPSDRVGTAQKCTKAGLTLAYEAQAPKSLVDEDKYLLNFCLGIDECELPDIRNISNAVWDRSSCTISADSPWQTAGRFGSGEFCKLQCAPGYELDARYGQQTGVCTFGVKGGKTSNTRVIGNPPGWAGGTYALTPVCNKKVTSGWLSKVAGEKCLAGANGYELSADDKNPNGCPQFCVDASSLKAYGTDGKQNLGPGNKCSLMASADNKYNPTVKKFCCCAKAGCFDASGKLKTAAVSAELSGSPDASAATTAKPVPATTAKVVLDKCGRAPTPAPGRPLPKGATKVTAVSAVTEKPKAVLAGSTSVGAKAAATTPAPLATKVTGDLKLNLGTIPANFSTDPKVKDALQQAIADTVPGVKKEYIKILNITSNRRLSILHLSESARRLAGDVTVKYEITLPSTWTGGAITAAHMDSTKLKAHVNTQFTKQGVSAEVKSVVVANHKSEKVTRAPVTSAPTTAKKGPGSASGALLASPTIIAAAFSMMGIFVASIP